MPTIIKNGRNYSGTSVSLTQAEYDALPEVTKMNGTTYFITDSDVVLNAEDVALDEGNLNDLAGSVATIETSPATANHEVGEYILWNGVLYTVTSAIATGENLVINSNISVRTIGDELTSLNNGLTSFQIRKVNFSYSIAANGNTHGNLYTLINNNMPSGYRFLAFAGFNTASVNVFMSNMRYVNSDYSIELRNVSSTTVTQTSDIFYLCAKI